jgi:hypothetical protein
MLIGLVEFLLRLETADLARQMSMVDGQRQALVKNGAQRNLT